LALALVLGAGCGGEKEGHQAGHINQKADASSKHRREDEEAKRQGTNAGSAERGSGELKLTA
jgi:hypothetical protein